MAAAKLFSPFLISSFTLFIIPSLLRTLNTTQHNLIHTTDQLNTSDSVKSGAVGDSTKAIWFDLLTFIFGGVKFCRAGLHSSYERYHINEYITNIFIHVKLRRLSAAIYFHFLRSSFFLLFLLSIIYHLVMYDWLRDAWHDTAWLDISSICLSFWSWLTWRLKKIDALFGWMCPVHILCRSGIYIIFYQRFIHFVCTHPDRKSVV